MSKRPKLLAMSVSALEALEKQAFDKGVAFANASALAARQDWSICKERVRLLEEENARLRAERQSA